MRSIPFYPLMVVLLIGLGGYLGCDPNNIEIPGGLAGNGLAPTTNIEKSTASGNFLNPPASATVNASMIPARTVNTIMVGSFNMERLGPSKLGNPWVMERFAEIIRQFDVIALQEITSSDQRTLPILVQEVNRNGGHYSYTISPRIGRKSTGYYEQYAYVFDTTRVQSSAEVSYVVADEADVLHREPFCGRFQTITRGVQPFNFTLINIHTDPDEIGHELDVLADVFRSVRQYEYPEDDVMLLGDLNAPPNGLRSLGQIPDLVPLIQNLFTNTVQKKALDNILADRVHTREFTGRAGIINLEKMFGLTLSDAERISDHVPIWAEFSITEQPTNNVMMGNNPSSLVR
ncbi:MAG: endonuclease/exonuclease/phosphatase family protein [Pirellulaceae bacterium]|nr:endonuclease/exonuclease/phosphatase family protein [Pirellulaceae bacterium]